MCGFRNGRRGCKRKHVYCIVALGCVLVLNSVVMILYDYSTPFRMFRVMNEYNSNSGLPDSNKGRFHFCNDAIPTEDAGKPGEMFTEKNERQERNLYQDDLGQNITQEKVEQLRRNCAIPKDVTSVCPSNLTSSPSNLTYPASFNIKNCALDSLTRSCQLFTEIHGYGDQPVAEEEKEFPLAFGIKMHGEPEQAEQLLRSIYRPHNVYCIHIDAKSPAPVVTTMSNVARCLPNVHITPVPISYVYKSFDVVRAELRNMACALQSPVPWRYYLNLAGQEMPLRTNLEMVRILKLFNGTNDIETFPIPPSFKRHYSHRYVVVKGKMTNTNETKKPPPFSVEIRKGTQYGAFSRAFVTSLLYDDGVREVMDYFKDTVDPDEKIWGTVIQLPGIPGGYPVHVIHSPSNGHISKAVAWWKTDPYKCRGRYQRQVCIFVQDDMPWILEQPNLFINKFLPSPKSLAAASCLEAVIGQRARSHDVVLNESLYLNLPHVKYRNKLSLTITQSLTTLFETT